MCSGYVQEGSIEKLSLLLDLKNSSYEKLVRSRCVFMWLTNDCLKQDLNWTKYELAVNYWFPIKIKWIGKYKIVSTLTLSQFGWCKTFNIVGSDQMFSINSIAEHLKFRSEKSFNQTTTNEVETPLFTDEKGSGFQGLVKIPENTRRMCGFHSGCNADSIEKTLVIHSPYEMPDVRHKNIKVQVLDLMKIAIDPQIKINDETILGFPVDE